MLFTSQKSKKTSLQEDLSLSLEQDIVPNIEDRGVEPIEDGILLVQAYDPLSILFSHITRQEYALVGTYSKYPTKIGIDLVSIFNGQVPYWVSNYKYLQDLIQSGGVGKIMLYPFLSDLSMSPRYYQPSSISTRELLINLFGHNLVVLPGIQFLLPNLYPNGDIPDTTKVINPLDTLISHSKLINHNKISVINSDMKEHKKYKTDRIYLSKVVATFIDMILTDPDFLDLVSGNYLNRVHSYDLLYDLVISHIEIQNRTSQMIRSIFLNDGLIDKDKLQDLIVSINTVRDITSEQLNIPTNQITPPIPDALTVIDRTPAPVIIQSVDRIRDQVNRIVETINNGQTPYIELNNIIGSINDLSEYYNLGPEINLIQSPTSGLIIISPYKEIAIPLTLKSGNKITLTTRNFNLSIFTRDELIEILETIETLISDDRYDYLRARITEEIAKR